MRLLLVCFVLAAVVSIAILTSTTSSQTLVDYQKSLNGIITCKSGRLQSPVNLVPKNSFYQADLNYLADDYTTITGRLSLGDDGSVYTLTAPTGTDFGAIYFSRKGYLTKNSLVKIQVNYPGEHTIEGKQADLEVKLIHQRAIDYQNSINQNKKVPSINTQFTIVLLFKQGETNTDNGLLVDLFNGWKTADVKSAFTSTNPISINLDAKGVLKTRPFYYYEGSHTFTPCDEDVNYLVITDYFKMDPDLYNFLSAQFRLRYLGGIANKPISDLNGRAAYRNFMITTDVSSASLLKVFLLLVTLMLVVFI